MQAEVVQLQAVTLASKLLILSVPAPVDHNATSTPQAGQLTSKASHTIALLAQYIFRQAAASPMFYDVRDRARTLGALVRGVNMDVYRASVASASSFSAASASNTLIHGGGDDGGDEHEGVEVSAEDWDRQMHAHAIQTTFTNGHGVGTTWGEGNTRDDAAVAGGVILRVEQVRVVLFDGKGLETNLVSKGFGKLACFHLYRILLRKAMALQRPHTPWALWVIWSDGTSLAQRIVS